MTLYRALRGVGTYLSLSVVGGLMTISMCAAADDFSIAIIRPLQQAQTQAQAASEESTLQQAISETDDEDIAFVVVNGIKSAQEPCSDALYLERKILFDAAKNGLFVSLAGSDWTLCKTSVGKSASSERLTRLRELFFAEDFSFGASKIPLIRQSATPKFRSYAENIRWEVGSVLFATINLPGNDNHYRAAGGRNNEFEDRAVANQHWLQQLVSHARTHKLEALVLFCDQNPLAAPLANGQRDGFSEIRSQIQRLADQFPGRLLMVHAASTTANEAATAGINWKGKLGTLAVAPGWLKLKISPSSPAFFSLIHHEHNEERKESSRVTNKRTTALK